MRKGAMAPLKVARYLLYASFALGILSVAKEVSLLYSLLVLGALGFSFWAHEMKRSLLPNWLITSLITPFVLLNLYGLHWNVFFHRIMGILFLLITAKLLAQKKMRDYLQLYLLSLLLVAGAAVVRWGMEFALLLAVEAFLLLTGLIFLYTSVERDSLSSKEVCTLFLWGGTISFALLPISFLFFLILPRPNFTLTPGWAGGKVAVSGFGEKVTPGAIEEIKRDTSVALRVEWLKGRRPPSSELYWRGKIYVYYQKGQWVSPQVRGKPPHPALPPGREVEYRAFLEPYQGRAIFTLGVPLKVDIQGGKALKGLGYTLHVMEGFTHRKMYRVRSRLVKAYPALVPTRYFLQVPREVRERILSLARSIAPEEKDPFTLARAVERYLKANHGYTTCPGYKGPYPVVDFLLGKGKGHCEYFASAMALLLRLRGIPARLLAGFVGGEWNPLGKYYIIRNADAHTWVEVYKKGVGWVPWDPTPPLPPTSSRKRLSQIERLLDYMKFQWYHWIISYDVEKQTRLFKKTLALFSPSQRPYISFSRWGKWALLLLLGLVAGGLLLIKLLLWCGKRPKTWGEEIVGVLKKRGIAIRPGETLLEMARRIKRENPALGEKLEEAVSLYYWREYGKGQVDPSTLKGMIKQIKTLSAPKRHRPRE